MHFFNMRTALFPLVRIIPAALLLFATSCMTLVEPDATADTVSENGVRTNVLPPEDVIDDHPVAAAVDEFRTEPATGSVRALRERRASRFQSLVILAEVLGGVLFLLMYFSARRHGKGETWSRRGLLALAILILALGFMGILLYWDHCGFAGDVLSRLEFARLIVAGVTIGVWAVLWLSGELTLLLRPSWRSPKRYRVTLVERNDFDTWSW